MFSSCRWTKQALPGERAPPPLWTPAAEYLFFQQRSGTAIGQALKQGRFLQQRSLKAPLIQHGHVTEFTHNTLQCIQQRAAGRFPALRPEGITCVWCGGAAARRRMTPLAASNTDGHTDTWTHPRSVWRHVTCVFSDGSHDKPPRGERTLIPLKRCSTSRSNDNISVSTKPNLPVNPGQILD